jgi:hypothetical protein
LKDILAKVPEPREDSDDAAHYWELVTLAEAHFGIGSFEDPRDLYALTNAILLTRVSG